MLVDLNLEEDATSVEWEKLLEYFRNQKKGRSDKDEEDTRKSP